MAEGALARSPANVAVSITGVAGPNVDEDGNQQDLFALRSLAKIAHRYTLKNSTEVFGATRWSSARWLRRSANLFAFSGRDPYADTAPRRQQLGLQAIGPNASIAGHA
jgi:hypothetical protein